MAFDPTKPVTTDNYNTVVLQTLQANQAALGQLLDSALVTASNQPSGTKRYNSTSQLFEQWNGSSWASMPLAYATLAGNPNFTGAPTIGGVAIATQNYVNSQGFITSAALSPYAPLASPNFSGTPQIAGAAIATQAYVTGLGYLTSSSAAATYLPLSGGTITGALTLNGGVFTSRGFQDSATASSWKIDPSGRWLQNGTPQPMLVATRTIDQTGSPVQVVYGTETLDTNNEHSTSTGVYTAAIGGVRLFFATVTVTNTSGVNALFDLNLVVSGITLDKVNVSQPDSTTVTYTLFGMHKMANGDTADVRTSGSWSSSVKVAAGGPNRFVVVMLF